MSWQSPPSVIAVVHTPPPWCISLAFSIDVHTRRWHCSRMISFTFSFNYHFAPRPWIHPSKDHCLIMTMSAVNAIKWKWCRNSRKRVKKKKKIASKTHVVFTILEQGHCSTKVAVERNRVLCAYLGYSIHFQHISSLFRSKGSLLHMPLHYWCCCLNSVLSRAFFFFTSSVVCSFYSSLLFLDET